MRIGYVIQAYLKCWRSYEYRILTTITTTTTTTTPTIAELTPMSRQPDAVRTKWLATVRVGDLTDATASYGKMQI